MEQVNLENGVAPLTKRQVVALEYANESAAVASVCEVECDNPELGTHGHDGQLRDAVQALIGPDHNPRFNAAKTLEHSEAFWDAVEPLKRELLARVHATLAAKKTRLRQP